MLNPDDRRLYTDALRPPPGFRFTEAVAGTYSLDLDTLLTIPLHLALFSAEQPLEELLKDGVALLEALRRTTDRVTVYAHASRVIAPGRPHVLYGLLEQTVVEALPPAEGGSFHPKVWVIRFDDPDADQTLIRLMVLTRNITADRCWDLVLTLEGEPGSEPVEDNRPLHDLVRRFPRLAQRTPSEERVEQAERLADLALRTQWELPGDYERVRFHALGLGDGGWLPAGGDKLAVISPFLSATALDALLETTTEPLALVSRPEELTTIHPALLQRFRRVMVLAERAERQDGEDTEDVEAREPERPSFGLHAKALAIQRGWYTHLYVGSANASHPALIAGTNVELMAELITKRSRSAVADLLGGDGFGNVLVDYEPPDQPEAPDAAAEEARETMDRVRRELAAGSMQVRYEETGDGWVPTLAPSQPLDLTGIRHARAWLVTRKPQTAADVLALGAGVRVPLEPALLQHVTSFVVFELAAEVAEERVRFVLNLQAEGLPVVERDAAIVRDVIRNREGFLRYVMLLLAEAGEGGDVFGGGAGAWDRFAGGRPETGLPLFEHLIRAFCRHPERLEAIRRLVEEIGGDGDGQVVPPEFMDLWKVFEGAVAAQEKVEA